MAEEQIISAIFDALGISSNARQQERLRQDEDFERTVKGFEGGLTAKEQGLDPKMFEERFGPYRAAQLLGAEKTQAFQQAAQHRGTINTLKQAAQQFLTGPAAQQTQTLEGITPEEAQGFYPQLQGPGISGPASMATANITARSPGQEDFTRRLPQISGEQRQLLFGTEGAAAGLSQRQLEEHQRAASVAEPLAERGRAVDEGQLAVSQQNAATSAGNLGLERERFDSAKGVDTKQRVAGLTSQIMQWNPLLGASDARKIAKFHAGELPERALRKSKLSSGMSLADVPGVLRGTGKSRTALTPTALFQRRSALRDANKTYVKSLTKAPKASASITDEQLDSQNNADLTAQVLASLDLALESADAPLTAEQLSAIVDEELAVATFAQKRGSRVRAATIKDLDEAERQLKRQQIFNIISDRYAELSTANSADAAFAVGQRYTEGGGAPASSPAPAAQPTATMGVEVKTGRGRPSLSSLNQGGMSDAERVRLADEEAARRRGFARTQALRR